MDNDTAQNPQDSGFSLMYGAPISKPKRAQDSAKDGSASGGEPEVKVKQDKIKLPSKPPDKDTLPDKKDKEPTIKSSNVPLEPVSETQTEAGLPLAEVLPEGVPPTSPFPTDDSSQTQPSDTTQSQPSDDANQPPAQTPPPPEPLVQPSTPPDDSISTTQSVTQDQPEADVPMAQPPVQPTTPPPDDTSSILSTDDQILDDKTVEPQSIEQALGINQLPAVEPPTPPEPQSKKPVPLPTDITEEPTETTSVQPSDVSSSLTKDSLSPTDKSSPLAEEPKVVEIPEGPELEEIEKSLTPEEVAKIETPQEKITIKDKLSSAQPDDQETAPVLGPTYQETPPPTEDIQTTPQEEIPVQPVPIPQEPTDQIQEVQTTTELPSQQGIEQPQTVEQPIPEPPEEKQPLSEQPVQTAKTTQPKPPPQKPTKPEKSKKKLKGLNKSLKFATGVGVLFLIVSLGLIATPSLPYIWYRLSSQETTKETESITEPTTGEDENSFAGIIEDASEGEESELPEYDPTLSYFNTLTISGIGVDGVIHESEDPQSSLEDGIWRVYDFGTPADSNTTILAAHRFGYITWTNEFRTQNTFYYLPKTKVGDKIEIVWSQRKYEYEITKAEEGTVIKDYDVDLIIYTCKLFNTPVRIFRYANRTN